MYRLSFIVLCTFFCLFNGSAYTDYVRSHESDITKSLPRHIDLYLYMNSLQNILEFCSKNKYDLDLNFVFGLFLANVNLKLVLQKKYRTLPKILIDHVEAMLKNNDELIEFFDYMVRQNENPRDRLNKMIISLFSNETKWMTRISEFDMKAMKKPDEINTEIEEGTMTMSEYIDGINNFHKWVPDPRLSDMCMVSLAENPDHLSTHLPRCEVYVPCYEMLINGTDFGYALSHRLLFLINAKHSRGCTIFSQEKDRELTNKFCSIAFEEVKFITKHGYEIIDLVLELITLCVVEGHAQFLQHTWLSNSVRYQTTYGCFSVDLPRPSEVDAPLPATSSDWKLGKQNHQILGGRCNGHLTSVAAAALGAAIRYILEVHF